MKEKVEYMKKKLAVVAVGGNSLVKDIKKPTLQNQMEAVRETCHPIADLIEAGWQVVITHGNGPQVGFLMRRSELAQAELPLIPMEILVADTQGGIGYQIQQSLMNEFKRRGIRRKIATVITQVLIDENDPAFLDPTKPIGGFMTEQEAESRRNTDGWTVKQDSGRGWRRVVASPEPKAILEFEAIKDLVDKDYIVICVGGGGIPVVDHGGELHGVAAVIDKDYASSVLARELHADALLVTTAVEKVSINYGKPDQLDLDHITVKKAEQYMAEGHFPPGSMGPKVSAILRYLDGGTGQGIITSPAKLVASVNGESGTSITIAG